MSPDPQEDVVPSRLSIQPELTEALLADFIRREVRRTGLRRAVVGVSGGLDSAVVLILAVRALGAASVLAVLLPYRTSAASSERDGLALLRGLKVPHLRVDISPMIDGYFRRFPRADRHRRGNKMARERMAILYDLSAQWKGLVLGTTNKSEMLLGYGTIHGDLACALHPIGDLYKTQVRRLARHLGVPARILRKSPSADLYPGQTDEKDLGYSYARVDRLLHFLVDVRGERRQAIAAGFPGKMIDRVLEQIRRSQYKRRMPLIAKVSDRTIGVDFRYPRDWGN